MSGKSALILGATGAVGKHLLRELLASPHFDTVGEFGRRVTDKEKLAGLDLSKLVQKTIDFDKLPDDDQGLKEGEWDVIFITLGTTRAAAGSAAAFEKIDREYVINAVRAAKIDGKKQKIVYCSSVGADATSIFLYPRSKGLTEIALASLGYEDTIVFRPGHLANAERGSSRITEKLFDPVSKALSRISDAVQIDVGLLAKVLLEAGHLGSEGLPKEARATKAGPAESKFTLIVNSGALAMGKLV